MPFFVAVFFLQCKYRLIATYQPHINMKEHKTGLHAHFKRRQEKMQHIVYISYLGKLDIYDLITKIKMGHGKEHLLWV